MSAQPPQLPPDPPKIPTFRNKAELQSRVAAVFQEFQESLERHLGTSAQGVTGVPLLYFVAHLEGNPEGFNQEVSFLRRPETYVELANITSKVIMRDPTFMSAITYAYADVMAKFFMGVGDVVKSRAPDTLPSTEEDTTGNEPDESNVVPFGPKIKPDPMAN